MELPKRIGRYDVLRLLGQGGMGRVLLAKDTVLGREVAVKVVRDDLGLPPEMREALFLRMKQEARAAAAVSHPSFVTLHDMGEEADVGVFLVFEYVKGHTLRERIAKGPLDPDDVYKIARDVGAALDRAHEAGVIHRDVKPENVLMSSTGPKLTDFGIARLPDSTLTRAGSVLGTAAYSAPEALALAEFSGASDQFSLAVTLYEAFGGARAFPGDDTLAVASRIATEEPTPLRAGPEGEELPRVHLVLARAMSKDPKKRFSSCTELARALYNALYEQIEVIEPVPMSSREYMTPPPSSSIVPPPPQRFRVQNIVVAAALLLIIGLLLFGRHSSSDGDDASKPAGSTSPSDVPAEHAHAPSHRADHRHPKAASSSKLPSMPEDPAGADENTGDGGASGVGTGASLPLSPVPAGNPGDAGP